MGGSRAYLDDMRVSNSFLLFLCLALIAGAVGQGDARAATESGGSSPGNSIVSRSETVAGLDGAVEIARDRWGIPTIIAATDHDLLFGFGYAMAEDRLWQMDGSRRLARGRVAEIAGQEQLHWDTYHRTLGLGRVADESVDLLAPDTREHLQAFADGVNAYITRGQDCLGFEFLLMNYRPQPWSVADTLAIGRLVAVWLAADSWDEEMYGALVDYLGEETASRLFRPVPEEEPEYSCSPTSHWPGSSALGWAVMPPSTPSLTVGLPRSCSPAGHWPGLILEPLARLSRGRHLEASNVWAVDGSMTESGEPILAMDPHLNYFAPSILYEVRLESPRFHCWGATFPGMPALPFGANQHISWGASNFPADCQDLYVEKLNPKDPTEYEVDGEWVPFEKIEERIAFKTSDGREQMLQMQTLVSRHGPVVEQADGSCFALRWTGFEASDDVTSFFLAMQAESLEEFYEAFREYKCPPQNLGCAESGRDGRVGQVIIGRVPIRSGYDGSRPVDGSLSSNDWVGYVPYDDLPHRLDPPEGFVAHANNLPRGALDGGDRPLGSSFSTNHRVNRIIECLVGRSPLTLDDMRLIQMDDLDVTARVFIPALLAAWDRAGADYPDLADAVLIVQEWDLRLSEESVGATIYQLWLIELAESCTTDHISYRLALYTSYEDRWLPVLEDYVAGKTDIPWLEDDDEGTRDHRVLDSLRRAIERLEREAGPDQSGWAWGDVHKAVFPHPSGVAALIGGGSHPWGGGHYTIRVGHYGLSDSLPFENDFGAVFRAVVASVDGRWRIEAVLPPGEGGSPVAPHFTDQMQLWLDGELREVAFETTDLEPVAVLQLVPE